MFWSTITFKMVNKLDVNTLVLSDARAPGRFTRTHINGAWCFSSDLRETLICTPKWTFEIHPRGASQGSTPKLSFVKHLRGAL